MLGRVGALQQRYPRKFRLRQIVEYAEFMTGKGKPITVRSTARKLGLKPSTHVRDMLFELEEGGMLVVEVGSNSWGNEVYNCYSVNGEYHA